MVHSSPRRKQPLALPLLAVAFLSLSSPLFAQSADDPPPPAEATPEQQKQEPTFAEEITVTATRTARQVLGPGRSMSVSLRARL